MHYLYVMAKVTTPVMDHGSIAFHHIIIEAPDEDAAYKGGQRFMAMPEAGPFVRECQIHEIINDYVIPVPGKAIMMVEHVMATVTRE